MKYGEVYDNSKSEVTNFAQRNIEARSNSKFAVRLFVILIFLI